MDSTTPNQQGPRPTPSPSPGNNCLLTMALAGARAHDCHVGLVQRHGTRLSQQFVSLCISATAGIRSQKMHGNQVRFRIAQAPPTELRIPLGFPVHDPQDIIANGIFYYAHFMCAAQTSELLTAIGLHAPGNAIEDGIRSLCTNHQIAVVLKKRRVVGLDTDTVLCVRLHQYDTIFSCFRATGFTIPLFEHPTIGIYTNGDIVLGHASLDVPRILESRNTIGEIRNWLKNAQTVKAEK